MNKTLLFLLLLAVERSALLAQPTITQPPTNQVVLLGETVTLSVIANGVAPLAYQWFKDSRWLIGATNNILTVANTDVANSGTYSVIVTNGSGMVASQPATVAVGNPSLLAWGNNTYGQLGGGTTSATNLPITVTSNVVAGAAGYNHSLFVAADGKLWTMGWNPYGQLGNGTSANSNPVPINVASGVVAAAAGYGHSLFIKTNGTLWAMGYGRVGQLGRNITTVTNPIPASVASNVVLVAAGEFFSLFVRTDGTLWAMGDNQYGQFGNGTTSNTNPIPAGVASNVVAIAAGVRHSLFVTTDGNLWGMGNNQRGQLGNGTTNGTRLPINVASNVVAVAAGMYHSLFLTKDSRLWAMGYNRYGQLGNGTTNDVSLPVNVASNVIAIATGMYHSLYVTTDGAIWVMGFNSAGQLGNGTAINTNQPANLPHYSVANVFLGSMSSHSLAIGVNYNGAVTLSNLNQTYTGSAIDATASTMPAGLTVNLTYNGSPVVPTNWGRYTVMGAINDPKYSGSVTNTLIITPVGPTNQMVAVGGMVSLSVASGSGPAQAYQWFKDGRRILGATGSTLKLSNAALTNSGSYYVVITNINGMFISLPASVAVGNSTLLAWGQNNHGQLGNGTTINASLPIIVASNVVSGAVGTDHSLFVTIDGRLWAMGLNGYGQMGNGASGLTLYPTPIRVSSNVVAVAAGVNHSLFIKTNGTLWVMGNNQYGQLGNGTTISTNLPVVVASNVVAVAVGYNHSLFLKNDGILWAVGQNQYGQLGCGVTSTSISTPVSVASNVVALAAGSGHSMFMTTDGRLWAMGANFNGQLGNGTMIDTNLPVSVASNVVAIAAGRAHSLFVVADGTLWTVGNNYRGELGNRTNGISDNPTPICVASNVLAAAAGSDYSLFLAMDGAVWAMGYNTYGQLGNGVTSNTNQPVNLRHFSVASIFSADQANHSMAIGINTQAIATVTLGSLTQAYTGSGISATASTVPTGLVVDLTYNGSPDAPTNPGSYSVVGRINDQNYQGSASRILVVLPLKPANQVVAVGGTINLSVAGLTLAGDPPLAYQWFKDARRLTGATNSMLTVSNADVTDSGTYYVVLTNANMMTISLPALVAVGNPTLSDWGGNYYGQLGNGMTNDAHLPATVASNVVAAAAGGLHSLFVTRDGLLCAMGWGGWGQLGNGYYSGDPQTTPISVANDVVAVAAGYGHSLFVKSDGTLWAMGWNISGQLGNGDKSRNAQNAPVFVASDVMGVAAGFYYSQFLKTDGTLWMAGNGNATPVIVASNVVTVAAGFGNAMFVTTDGTLWTQAPSPVVVASNVVAVAMGGSHSLYVTKDGILWGMGANGSGQLGNGTTNDAPTPVNLASNVLAVAAGSADSLFLITNGMLYAMGNNNEGEFGNGTNGNYYTLPVIVPHLSLASVFGANAGSQSLAIGINYMDNSINISGKFPSFSFVGMPGANYLVKRSTNLIDWSIIWTTNEPDNGVFQFADPAAPQPNAYYRLQPNP